MTPRVLVVDDEEIIRDSLSFILQKEGYEVQEAANGREAFKKVSGGNTLRGPLYWAGLHDQHFAAVFLPDDPDAAAQVTPANNIENTKAASKPPAQQLR